MFDWWLSSVKLFDWWFSSVKLFDWRLSSVKPFDWWYFLSLRGLPLGGVVRPRVCHSLWQGDFNRKQVVNRLKIPQGLSTQLFHRWSEVPLKGRGSAVIHRKKKRKKNEKKNETPALHRGHPTACGSVILVAVLILSLPPVLSVSPSLWFFLGFVLPSCC